MPRFTMAGGSSNKRKDEVSKRRPRQNIIYMILKNAKAAKKKGPGSKGSNGSSTAAASARSGGPSAEELAASGGGTKSSGGNRRPVYQGSKRGILQSAVELTRRSKRAATRSSRKADATSRRSKSMGRSRRSKTKMLTKGQKVFYKSDRGISKVVVVGVHHDSKLEPYYTIRLKDGKEKQTDGKHLTPVESIEDKKDRGDRNKNDEAVKRDIVNGVRENGVVENSGEGGEVDIERSKIGTDIVVADRTASEFLNSDLEKVEAMTGEDNRPLPPESFSQDPDANDEGSLVEVEEEGVDDASGNEEPLSQRGGNGWSDSDNDLDDAPVDGKKFHVDQDVYYRHPSGRVSKVRVISSHGSRYTIALADETRVPNVRVERLATLMDLTSKELSMLMKERNRRQGREESRGGADRTKSSRETSRDVSSSRNSSKDDKGRSRRDVSKGRMRRTTMESGTRSKSRSTSSRRKSLPANRHMNIEEFNLSGVASGSDPSLGNNNNSTKSAEVQMVEAKTETGESKMVPLYPAKMKVHYKNAAGVQAAEILDVHMDDLMEPYYTIRLDDGREKQTDNAHIVYEPERGVEKDNKEKLNSYRELYKEINEVSRGVDAASDEESGDRERITAGVPMSSKPVEDLPASNPLNEEKDEVLHEIDASDRTEDVVPKSREDLLPETPTQDTAAFRRQDTTLTQQLRPLLSPNSPHPPVQFTVGDEVLYNSSAGEHFRATIVRLQHDKKNRPYYVVRLRNAGGREKQVYGHRLQPYERKEYDKLRRQSSRSRSRPRDASKDVNDGEGKSGMTDSGRRRGRSKSDRDKSTDSLRRSESIDSRQTHKSRAESRAGRRRSMSSKSHTELKRLNSTISRSRGTRESHKSTNSGGSNEHQEPSLASKRSDQQQEDISTYTSSNHNTRRSRSHDTRRKRRDQSLSSTSRPEWRNSSAGLHKSNGKGDSESEQSPGPGDSKPRPRSASLRRSKSTASHRSRSRARSSASQASSRAPSEDASLLRSPSLRRSSSRSRVTPHVSMSSKATTASSTSGGSGVSRDDDSQAQYSKASKGKSIAKLRNFRKNFRAGQIKKE